MDIIAEGFNYLQLFLSSSSVFPVSFKSSVSRKGDIFSLLCVVNTLCSTCSTVFEEINLMENGVGDIEFP
jgi:hypothetical protein